MTRHHTARETGHQVVPEYIPNTSRRYSAIQNEEGVAQVAALRTSDEARWQSCWLMYPIVVVLPDATNTCFPCQKGICLEHPNDRQEHQRVKRDATR